MSFRSEMARLSDQRQKEKLPCRVPRDTKQTDLQSLTGRYIQVASEPPGDQIRGSVTAGASQSPWARVFLLRNE